MNSVALFQGKREDNGLWIYGRLLADNIIVPLNQEEDYCIVDGRIVGCNLVAYKVIPETVGQFTGLCDRNDDWIFEGDIIDWGFGLYVVVEYIKEYARFAGVNGDSIFGLDNTDTDNKKRVLIVGNIHDGEIDI